MDICSIYCWWVLVDVIISFALTWLLLLLKPYDVLLKNLKFEIL